ncbi:hypothetical protein BH24ACT26_BH24ACT26_15020 [soil metagenome]
MRLRTSILSIAAAVALAGCGSEATQPAAATVNGDKISVSDIGDALERFEETAQFDQLAGQSDEGSARRQFEQAYLAQQIRRAVIRPRAEELGIEVGHDEIDEQLEQIRSQFPSEKEFDKALEDRGFTSQELDALIRDQALEDKIRQEVTADQDLMAYYESHQEDYRETQVQHILVKDNRLALDISEQLRSAHASKVDKLFAALAKKHSTDPSNKDKGGELGWVAPGTLVEPFEAALGSLDIGEVSRPVRTEFGFHVIRVTGRRTKPFEQVSQEIQAQIGNEAFQRWLTDAYEEADVEVNPRYGELDLATGQIVNASSEDVPGADDSSEGSSDEESPPAG